MDNTLPIISSTYDETNREEWLNAAVCAIACRMTGDVFKRTLPSFHVSVGIPRHSAGHAIGQCWRGETSSDGLNHVFISPEIMNAVEIIAVLTHECVHAVDNCVHGHKGPFVKMVRAIGLEGKPTATYAKSGTSFHAWASTLAYALGPFPGARLNLTQRKKQTTRLVKIECSSCGFIARTTRKWLDQAEMPVHCDVPMVESGLEE